MTGVSILLAAAIAVLFGVALLYNQLVRRRQLVTNGWADIDVQLKRRSNLIPRLVETVKGYAAHERALFEEVVEKRNQAGDAGDDPDMRGAAETALSQPVAKLVAVAEDYPDLKANENFLKLQSELSDTETKIEMARRFYNGAVRELNIAVKSFPANLVAGPLGFAAQPFFEIDTVSAVSPKIGFEEG